jgi:hypothetical protein
MIPPCVREARVSCIDCTQSLTLKQRLLTIFIVKQGLATFWEEVRSELRPNYGQETGKRDRQKAQRRNDLAKQLRLSERTLKGFLNGNQTGLGEDARIALYGIIPGLQRRYAALVGRPDLPPVRSDAATGRSNELYIQLTLQLEGSDEPPKTLTARLPPGRERIVTLKIESGRVA